MPVERAVGPAGFLIRVSKTLAQVDVDIQLEGRTMTTVILTPKTNTASLDLANGGASIRGGLGAHFGYPGERSSLIADFVVTQKAESTPFRGDLAAWISPSQLVLDRQERWLTPELVVTTSIIDDPAEPVTITFRTVNVTFATLTLSSGANSAVVDRGYEIGTVQVAPGMTLQLQPATPTQDGQVYLKGTFVSSNLPKVDYAGAIATWPYSLYSVSARAND